MVTYRKEAELLEIQGLEGIGLPLGLADALPFPVRQLHVMDQFMKQDRPVERVFGRPRQDEVHDAPGQVVGGAQFGFDAQVRAFVIDDAAHGAEPDRGRIGRQFAHVVHGVKRDPARQLGQQSRRYFGDCRVGRAEIVRRREGRLHQPEGE